MIHDQKPPLDEALLIHYGVKGMKWGVHHTRPDEAERRARFSPKAKKIAAGVAVAGGAAAAAYLIAKHGNVPANSMGRLSKPNLKPSAWDKVNELRRVQGENFVKNSPSFNRTHHFNAEANRWSAEAGSTLARRVGSNSRTWASSMPNLSDLNAVRDAMNDPNFIWDL
jgi:hypothetical protein